MLDRRPRPDIIYVFLPAVAIAVLYGAFGALPQYRELVKVRAESEARAASIDQLRTRLEALTADKTRYETHLGKSTVPVNAAVAGERLVALEISEQSFVEAFARVLAAFQSQAVECTAAKPLGDLGKAPSVAQHVSLVGSFGNVLAAIDAVGSDVPSARVTELSMERVDAREPCRWDIVIQFDEEIE